MHSIIISQQNNWVLITQMETYYHDRLIDNVAFANLGIFVDKLSIRVEKCQEGKGSWCELRFSVGKLEVIATGGIYNTPNNDGFGAFLSVAVPPHLINDDRFILFSPCKEANRSQCHRMLRNYKKRASLYTWCSKSDFFCNLNFCTPITLELYHTEQLSYATICSKLINLSVSSAVKMDEVHVLVNMLKEIQCWKDLGFETEPTKEEVKQKLQLIKRSKITKSFQKLNCF
ncbi:hypothetical protein G6F56_006597 [Rhizopus delemar]|nr:hypothetical protein G6F56_006597 [Rhizopus delemar]